MTTRRRLTPAARQDELLDVGAQLFASRPYEDVLMEDVAAEAGVSRALLYRYFPSKRDLFAAIYQRAADRLLGATELDPAVPLAEQIAAGLDAHIDYFVANRHTVLTANRALAGDPIVGSIIADELAVLQTRLVGVIRLSEGRRRFASVVVMGWLALVQALCVEWLEDPSVPRAELRDVCTGALLGALEPILEGNDLT